jgi:hypothetical protein
MTSPPDGPEPRRIRDLGSRKSVCSSFSRKAEAGALLPQPGGFEGLVAVPQRD